MPKQKRTPTWKLRDVVKEWANKSNNQETKQLLLEIAQRLEEHRQLRKTQGDFRQERREFYEDKNRMFEQRELKDAEIELLDSLKRFISCSNDNVI